MSDAGRPEWEAPLVAWLAACDDAMALGGAADLCPADLPPGSRPGLAEELAFLQRLRRDLSPTAAPHSQGDTILLPDNGDSRPSSRAPLLALGRFEIRRELGRGGFGVVFQAYDPRLGRDVALKVPRADVLVTPELRRRFFHEARAAAALDHPNLVAVYEAGEVGPVCFIASAYCPGITLADWLRGRTEFVPIDLAAGLVATLADAVGHAHERGVVHRDLKPANVLLETIGRERPGDREGACSFSGFMPRITDFGLAKFLSDEIGASPTRSGVILGTPSYMAPEQAEGRSGSVGPTADVYALGALFYELLAGRPPFRGESDLQTLRQVRDDDPVSPRRLRAEVPRDLEVICLKCLEKDSRRRYSGAQALSDDLLAWLAGWPIAARPAGAVERLALFVRRRPTLAAAYGLLAAVLVLLGIGGGVAWLWRAAERARGEAVVARDYEARARAEAEQAHQGELRSRAVAEQARDSEVLARAAAERARDGEARARAEAERQREKVDRVEYGRTLQVALEEWRANNITATLALLHSTRPDLHGWEWRHLNHLCHSELFSLDDTSDTESVSFSPDGSRIMTVGKSGRTKVWDAGSGAEILTLGEPSAGRINWSGRTFSGLAAFNRDGSRIVTANPSGMATLWDAMTGTGLLSFGRHSAEVSSVAFCPDGSRIVTASQDGTVMVWDAADGAEVLALSGHAKPAYSASFSPDGSRIVTASRDRTARVWDAASGAQLLVLKGHADSVDAALFSPDGSRIVTASRDRTARVWDAARGVALTLLKGHTLRVTSASFSPDGSRIVTASFDKTAKLWDSATGTELRTLNGHTTAVYSASFSPDGSRIVTGGSVSAKVWDATGRKDVRVLILMDLGRSFHSVFLSPDGLKLILARRDGATQEFDPTMAAELLAPAGYPYHFSASYSPDGSRIVTSNVAGTAKVYDESDGAELLTLKGHTWMVGSASYSPDGSRIVTASWDRSARIWDAARGVALTLLKGHTMPVPSASFSPDGSRIVTASWDKTARVWDAASGAQLLVLKGHADSVDAASFSPDGLRIVTASRDRTARVWDAARGVALTLLKGHTLRVTSASFSPDGSRIVTTSRDSTAKVWDSTTGMEIFPLKGHTDQVDAASFSPDGSRIVTASEDRTVKVWDATTGTDLLTFKGHAGSVRSSMFSPDGSRILTCGDDGTARVWHAGPASPSSKRVSEREIEPQAQPRIMRVRKQGDRTTAERAGDPKRVAPPQPRGG